MTIDMNVILHKFIFSKVLKFPWREIVYSCCHNKFQFDLNDSRLAKEERAAKVGNFVQRFQLSGVQLEALAEEYLET